MIECNLRGISRGLAGDIFVGVFIYIYIKVLKGGSGIFPISFHFLS